MVGEVLGPYKILEQLGAGGMGEVYLGEDTRLGRKVAVKVLPAEFASDPERLARFEQEARAAAALNHPHIAAVFDVGAEFIEGSDAPTHFMVQEYLEGQSLRERLEQGAALPLDTALALATEVAEALVAAHKAGIVHRDLKPDNVFVTEQGHAKVLDFGLAKLTEAIEPADSELSMSPTMLGTVAGQVMGTAGYMSPEQVNGEEVDARADIFAFGALLYETVTGARAFAGKSIPDTLSLILHDEPPPVPESMQVTPMELDRIVTKCLAKDKGRRYQGATDLAVDLRALAANVEAGTAAMMDRGPEAPGEEELRSGTPTGVPLRLAAAGAIALVAVTALIMQFARQPGPPPSRTAQLAVDLPTGMRFTPPTRSQITISSDGTHLAFTADGHLWIRNLEEQEPTPVPDTGGSHDPMFSPDNSQVGYFVANTLWTVAVSGGAPVRVAEQVPVPFGASWSDTGTIFVGGGVRGIWSVPASGGEATRVIEVEDGSYAYGPQLLPDGEWILFTLKTGTELWSDASIVAARLDGGEAPKVLARGTDARFVSTGHLVFTREGTLFALALDVGTLETTGAPMTVADNIVMAGAGMTGAAQYAFAENGRLVYISPSGRPRPPREVVWVDRSGNVLGPAIEEPIIAASFPALSPDGTRLVLNSRGALWIYPLDGAIETRAVPGSAQHAVWTPDGRGLVFEGVGGTMYRVAADSSGQSAERIGDPNEHRHPYSWTPEGDLIYHYQPRPNAASIWSMPLDGSRSEAPILDRESSDGAASVAMSPNGRWLAFDSNIEGSEELYVMEYPDGEPERISPDGGAYPRWSHDGQEIFYVGPGEGLMSAGFDPNNGTITRPAEPLFPTQDFRTGGQAPLYDVAPDGRFLMIKADVGPPPQPKLRIVLNWFEELKALVPTER